MQAEHNPRVEWIRTAAAIVVIVAGLKLGAAMLTPILLAAFFAMALMPMAVILERRGVPAWLATLVSFLLGALLIVLLGYLLASSLGSVREALPRYGARLDELMDQAEHWLAAKGLDVGEEGLDRFAEPEDLLGYVQGFVTSLAGVLSQSVVVILIMLFMLFERSVLTGSVTGGPDDVTMKQAIVQRIARSVTDYLSVKTVISVFTGLFFGLACWWIGVDFPLLWALLAFLLNYVPNIGSVIACVPAALVALVQLGWSQALLVVFANVAINTVLGNILEPRIMGNRVGVSALSIFLGLIFWAWVFGPVGALLSVPLTIIVKMLLEPAHPSDAPRPEEAAPPPPPEAAP